MNRIRLRKKKDTKKERTVMLFTIAGLVLVFGIWILQLFTSFSGDFTEGLRENTQIVNTQIQEGTDFGQEIESHLPDTDTNLQDVFAGVSEYVEAEVTKQQTLQAVARQVLEDLSAEPVANAAEEVPEEDGTTDDQTLDESSEDSEEGSSGGLPIAPSVGDADGSAPLLTETETITQ